MKFVLSIAAVLISFAPLLSQSNRQVAITIDDLPVVSTRGTLKNRQEITKKLLGHIKKAKVPAIGFVNENKLYVGDKRDEKQIDLLRMWLAAGLELGNHTFSHRSLNQIPLADYQVDLLKGETITKELLAAKGQKIRFFRHPFLQTGRTLEIKADFDKFLTEHGYTIAPISFDNADYIFSRSYDIAYDRGDKHLMKKVGDAYVPYMEKKLEYWERQSVNLFGREIAQTLLIHANFINSDYFEDLAAMFKRRGYHFVDLETALKDDAYRQPDKFVGGAGISWLHRWALDRGRENVLPDEPTVPDFVLKLSGFESE
ncbi:MAG: polysaccharide deacetylase family protein [Acidobacteria bacterium]|nr:polysaccharide deacetylase family protein [Acidobacteriota bacterium]MBP7476188.1 polysaccharide deacetylase family protein [Pyrinomonadaceae bacterium]